MGSKGTVVIITGGGTGIGRATALAFANSGANIAVCGRRLQPLKETVRLIEETGHSALAIQMDVRNGLGIENMVKEVLGRFAKIDILVNNAGIAIAKPIIQTEEDDWDAVLDTNLKGVFLCSKAVLPSMLKANKGVIINVSSVLGMRGAANLVAYCASKFGVIGFTEALAEEFKTKNIRLYAICPGATFTDLHRSVVGEEAARLSMTPEKVAAKIIGLAGGEISLASGSSLVVDEQAADISADSIKNNFLSWLGLPYKFVRLLIRRFKWPKLS